MLTAFVIISAVTYTLVRFVVVDTIFDTPREKVHDWLLDRKNVVALYAQHGLSCSGCMAFWFSLFTVLAADHNPWGQMSIPMPVLMVFACRTGALTFAVIIDPED
jgi:hypothetical protein